MYCACVLLTTKKQKLVFIFITANRYILVRNMLLMSWSCLFKLKSYFQILTQIMPSNFLSFNFRMSLFPPDILTIAGLNVTSALVILFSVVLFIRKVPLVRFSPWSNKK